MVNVCKNNNGATEREREKIHNIVTLHSNCCLTAASWFLCSQINRDGALMVCVCSVRNLTPSRSLFFPPCFLHSYLTLQHEGAMWEWDGGIAATHICQTGKCSSAQPHYENTIIYSGTVMDSSSLKTIQWARESNRGWTQVKYKTTMKLQLKPPLSLRVQLTITHSRLVRLSDDIQRFLAASSFL